MLCFRSVAGKMWRNFELSEVITFCTDTWLSLSRGFYLFLFDELNFT
jgi:hypothetical protein